MTLIKSNFVGRDVSNLLLAYKALYIFVKKGHNYIFAFYALRILNFLTLRSNLHNLTHNDLQELNRKFNKIQGRLNTYITTKHEIEQRRNSLDLSITSLILQLDKINLKLTHSDNDQTILAISDSKYSIEAKISLFQKRIQIFDYNLENTNDNIIYYTKLEYESRCNLEKEKKDLTYYLKQFKSLRQENYDIKEEASFINETKKILFFNIIDANILQTFKTKEALIV